MNGPNGPPEIEEENPFDNIRKEALKEAHAELQKENAKLRRDNAKLRKLLGFKRTLRSIFRRKRKPTKTEATQPTVVNSGKLQKRKFQTSWGQTLANATRTRRRRSSAMTDNNHAQVNEHNSSTTNRTNNQSNPILVIAGLAFVAFLIVIILMAMKDTGLFAKSSSINIGNPLATSATTMAPSLAPGNNGNNAYMPGNGNLQPSIDQFNKDHDALAFCKSMSTVIGGPVAKWWGTQNPDGSSVPNSCVLREADDTDGVPGWPVTLPMGTNSHIWLYDCNLPNNCHATVTATGKGTVEGTMLASRMTVYFVDGAYSASHHGMWTFGQLSGSDKDSACGWAPIGTTVKICSNSSGTSVGSDTSSSGNSACSINQIQNLTVKNVGSWNSVGENGGHYTGPFISFTVPNGFVVDTPSGRKSAGQQVNAGEFTAYCLN